MAFGAGVYLTDVGRPVLARAQAGEPLIFKRLQIGDGELGGQQPGGRIALVSPKLYVALTRLRVNANSSVTVGGKWDNSVIEVGFYLREIGVWVQDPDNATQEILYAYGNAGSGAQYISAGGSAEIIEKTINIVFAIGNASNVSATISSGQTVSYEDLIWDNIAEKPTTFPPGDHSHGWASITGRPVTFPPEDHSHAAADIMSGIFAAARLPISSAVDNVSETNVASSKAIKVVNDKAVALEQANAPVTTSGTAPNFTCTTQDGKTFDQMPEGYSFTVRFHADAPNATINPNNSGTNYWLYANAATRAKVKAGQVARLVKVGTNFFIEGGGAGVELPSPIVAGSDAVAYYSDTLLDSGDDVQTPTRMRTITAKETGIFRVEFDLMSAASDRLAYARLTRNNAYITGTTVYTQWSSPYPGVYMWTFRASCDVTLAKGDALGFDLWVSSQNHAYSHFFMVRIAAEPDFAEMLFEE